MPASSSVSVASGTDLDEAEQAVLRATGIAVTRGDVTVQGMRLHYLTCGEGEPLVLLHGRGEAGALFAPVLPALAAERRVFTLDLPGWGLSDKPPFTGTTARDALRLWVESVLGFLDAQGLSRVSLLGHSMGGFTALALALDHPERVENLILVDPGGLGTALQMDVRLYFSLGPERLNRLLGERFTRFVVRQSGGLPPEEMSGPLFTFLRAIYTQADVVPSGAAAFRRWVSFTGVHLTLTERLPELQMPVLMLWGDRDTVCPYDAGLGAIRQLRDGRLVAFTGCGHSPFRQRPDEFAHVLLTWLRRIYVPARV
jgi:4,5:9,10-diseco-3-hydroxy-5,9,17-trioxoandrosta-1(10),2-diene-4-oate hydrolase